MKQIPNIPKIEMTERNPDTAGVGIECMSERTPKERMSGGHSVSEPRAQSRGWAGQGEGTEGSALRMRLHYFSILYK